MTAWWRDSLSDSACRKRPSKPTLDAFSVANATCYDNWRAMSAPMLITGRSPIAFCLANEDQGTAPLF